MRLNDKDVNGKELTYAVFTVSDFCVQITSGLDQNLCGSGAENWAGGELKVIKQIKMIISNFQVEHIGHQITFFQILHNDVEIKSLQTGFTDETICIDGFDIQNDLFEMRASDSDDVSFCYFVPVFTTVIFAYSTDNDGSYDTYVMCSP